MPTKAQSLQSYKRARRLKVFTRRNICHWHFALMQCLLLLQAIMPNADFSRWHQSIYIIGLKMEKL